MYARAPLLTCSSDNDPGHARPLEGALSLRELELLERVSYVPKTRGRDTYPAHAACFVLSQEYGHSTTKADGMVLVDGQNGRLACGQCKLVAEKVAVVPAV